MLTTSSLAQHCVFWSRACPNENGRDETSSANVTYFRSDALVWAFVNSIFFLTLAVQRQCRREGSKTKEKLAQAQRKQTMWRHSSVRDRWPKYVKTRLSSNKQNLLLESACQPWKAMSSRKGGERGDRLSIIWSNAWRNWRRPLWRAECFRIE